MLENAFRELRTAWFNQMLHRAAHEREWEDEPQEQRRENRNIELRRKYDLQTEEIISGRFAVVVPCCEADLG